MDYLALAKTLSDVSGQSVYMKFQPEILDFTDKSLVPELHFHFQGGKQLSISLIDKECLMLVLQMLKFSLFGKGIRVVCWNWKNFASYILFKTGKTYSIDGSIIDIKILESYSGRKISPPKSLNEALNRLKDLISAHIWKEIEPIYKKLHLPLMTTVIPHLETSGIIDVLAGKKVYAYYDIDGQENGRLRCMGAYSDGYIPHAMKPEVRENLKPREENELFMVFDYKGMEVFVLAWMSQDPLLMELVKTPDVYLSIYEKLLGKSSDGKNDRDLAKKIFLPVIYGQSAYSLSQRCGIAIDAAEKVIERIDSLFPVALAFIESYQKQLKEFGYAKDIFGKRRSFEEGKEYSVRNFSIQSPAAAICLEKLNHLYFALKDKADIAYTVHDGYAVYATKENWKSIFKIGREVLSGESDLCPGLRLRVTCRAGRKLNELKSLTYKGD